MVNIFHREVRGAHVAKRKRSGVRVSAVAQCAFILLDSVGGISMVLFVNAKVDEVKRSPVIEP